MLELIGSRRKKGEKGQALVEFALLVPIFLILMFAIMDFGMGFYSWITVTNSAREGARLGAVHPPLDVPASPCFGKVSLEECIEDRVRETAGLPYEDTNLDVDVNCGDPPGPCPAQSGESVVVQVDYRYELMTPLASLIGNLIGSTLNLSSTADMRLE